MDGVVGLLLVRTEKDGGPYRLRTLEQAANNLISRKDLPASLNRNSWEENVARAREREGAPSGSICHFSIGLQLGWLAA